MARGLPPRLFYLRTRGQLEVDLIVEGLDHRPQPFELKLSKTPRAAMATGLKRFADLSPDPQPHPGRLVSLSEEAVPLSRGITAVPVGVFLDDVRRLLA